MSIFQDKFHLTPAQSLFLAKKKWDENVYCRNENGKQSGYFSADADNIKRSKCA